MAHNKPVNPVTYVFIYVLLLALTATTLLIGRFMHLERWEIPVALGIACAKTLLVALFFMHIAQSGKLTWLAMGMAVVFFSAFVIITLSDYWTRGWIYTLVMPG